MLRPTLTEAGRSDQRLEQATTQIAPPVAPAIERVAWMVGAAYTGLYTLTPHGMGEPKC